MRPRIRTLKPEFWGDEKVCAISRAARLTMCGLISAADDRGRLQLLYTALRGFIYPAGDVSERQLGKEVDEITTARLAIEYAEGSWRYLWLPNFWKHQRLNRPTESTLPPPPDDPYGHLPIKDALRQFTEDSLRDHGGLTESSVSDHGGLIPSRAGARSLPVPFPSVSVSLNDGKQVTVGADEPPSDFPDELGPHLDLVCGVLKPLAERQNAKAVKKRSLAYLIADPTRRHKPFVRAAHEFAAWADSKAQPRRDVIAGWRNWLDKCDDLAGVEQVTPRLQAVNGKRDFSKYDRAAGL